MFFGMLTLLIWSSAYGDMRLQPGKEGQKDKISLAETVGAESLNRKRGMILGRVAYEGDPPQPQKLMVVKDVAVCAKIDQYDESLVVGANKGIKDVVISLINVSGGRSLDAMGDEFVLDQTGCKFQPHVLLVPVNTPVQILNYDGVLHTFHTYSMKNGQVNIAQPPYLKRMKRAFKHPEKIGVRCDLHGWMHSWIIVIEHAYHAVTDADGKFTIPDIPPGTYTVHSWQEALGEQTAQVTVIAGNHVTVDFKYHPKASVEKSH